MIPQIMDGEELKRCPRRPVLDHPTSLEWFFRLYSWYKKGHLPDAGSYLDQAAAMSQLVEIFDRAVADAEAVKERGKPKP